MTERLFLKIDSGRLKNCIGVALDEVFKTTKGRIKISNYDNDIIANAIKYEILKEGIDFELEEPIPDYFIKKRNIADKIVFKEIVKDKDGEPTKVTIEAIYA